MTQDAASTARARAAQDSTTAKIDAPSGGWKRWLSSGLSLTVLMTGLFYIQGRMYRHGYIRALGLEESMFPIDTPQALWLAYQGWLSGAVQVPKLMDAALIVLLLKTGAIVFVVLVTIVGLVWIARKMDLSHQASKRIEKSGLVALFKNKTVIQFAATLPATVAGVLIVPLALMLAAIVLMYAFMILCMPFLALGSKDALAMCNAERSTVGLVALPEVSTPLVLLECSERFCALIQNDGSLRVVAVQTVERIDIVPVRRALPSAPPLPRCRVHQRSI